MTLAEHHQPNIIFILVDDLGWGDLGVFYQNEREQSRKHATPKLDQFATEGMQLRDNNSSRLTFCTKRLLPGG